MPDIYMDFPMSGTAEDVFNAVSTVEGLQKWWSKSGTGTAEVGGMFRFDFGPEYQWTAEVLEYEPFERFSLKMKEADLDWTGSVLNFFLSEAESGVTLRFEHIGWPEKNDHYRSSTYCWAMYLRCLKQYVEMGVVIPYEHRLDVN